MEARSITPVKVQFIGIMPTFLAHCEHCMDALHAAEMQPYTAQFEEYPEDVKREYFKLAETAKKIKDDFGDVVYFDAIDSASPQAIWMAIRHRIFRTPCVLIDGVKAFDRLPEYEELKTKIKEALDQRIS